MATTAPDGLISPDASDPYDLTSDMAAMQASTQAALSNRSSKSGSNSAMLSASGVREGTLWYSTSDQRLYRFNGTGWDGVAPAASVEEIHTYKFAQSVTPETDWKEATFTLPAPLDADRGLQGSILADASNSTAAVVVGTLARHTGTIGQVSFRFVSVPRNLGFSTNIHFVVSGYPA